MKEFIISLKNEPGALARVCKTLGDVGINMTTLYGEGSGENGKVIMITEDENTTEKVLRQGGFEFTTSEVMPLRIADRPGELAKQVYKLAYNKINIERIYLINKENGWVDLGMVVPDQKKAESALKG